MRFLLMLLTCLGYNAIISYFLSPDHIILGVALSLLGGFLIGNLFYRPPTEEETQKLLEAELDRIIKESRKAKPTDKENDHDVQ